MGGPEPMTRTPLLDQSLLDAPVIPRGDYAYFVHPLTDGIPALDPQLFDEIGTALASLAGAHPDRLVTAEAMGIPAGMALARHLDVPLTIVRKRPYGLPGEVVVPATTGYGSSTLHINGLRPGMRVTIVDDVVSTGGTLLALVDGIRQTGAEVIEILAVLSRGDGVGLVQEKTGVPVKTIRRIDVDREAMRVRILDGGA